MWIRYGRLAVAAAALLAAPGLARADGLTCGPPRTPLGPGPEPEIEIYSDSGFNSSFGHMLHKNAPLVITGQACRFIGGFDNDVASSVKVKSGTWRLWKDKDFQGRHVDLPKGDYPNLKDRKFNDALSSFEPVSKDPH